MNTNYQSFTLTPFSHSTLLSSIQIKGELSRECDRLCLRYTVFDPQQQVVLPTSDDLPTRRDELWQRTCLEFFFGPTHADHYWEVNLSPVGHWNVYRFDGYRAGMHTEAAIKKLPFIVESQLESLMLQVELELSAMVSIDQAVAVGVTAVLETSPNTLSYWALNHPGPEADFHRRDSFTLRI